MRDFSCWCVFLLLVVGWAMAGERALRRSDVVFMYDDPKLYEAYGCTAVGWAGWPNAKHIEEAHASGVRLFHSSIGFLTEFRRVIDFSDDFLDAACRNFAGEPFIVPWLWDHKHKGQPAWWWCTNSPLYRRYLASRLREVMRAKPDGLHIDDYRGTSGCVTWRGGGFCRHCMTAFRDYLGKHVAKAKLRSLGINDLAGFDYRQFLLRRGVTPGEYVKRRSRLPLAAEFYDFQVKAATEFVARFRKKAEELRGKPVTLSVNSGLSNPQALAIAPHVSFFCCEVAHHASRRRPPSHPVYVYKLADGLGRPVASTAGGWDWAFVNEHNLPGLVRTWVALSYAFGHNFMAPHRQWCYTKEKGTHWYSGPAEEYGWLYRFVRGQAAVLDGYEAVAPVAVVYGNGANRKGRGRIEAICTTLASRNVPFTVVVAGDDWLPGYRLSASALSRFKAVVVPKTLELDPDQQRVLDGVKAQGRLVVWPDDAALARLVPEPVAVEGASGVWVVPRRHPERGKPVAVHLLNRNYDAAEDAMRPQRGFTVRLARWLLGGARFTRATLHAPRKQPVELKLATDKTTTSFAVPELDLWAIAELRR